MAQLSPLTISHSCENVTWNGMRPSHSSPPSPEQPHHSSSASCPGNTADAPQTPLHSPRCRGGVRTDAGPRRQEARTEGLRVAWRLRKEPG